MVNPPACWGTWWLCKGLDPAAARADMPRHKAIHLHRPWTSSKPQPGTVSAFRARGFWRVVFFLVGNRSVEILLQNGILHWKSFRLKLKYCQSRRSREGFWFKTKALSLLRAECSHLRISTNKFKSGPPTSCIEVSRVWYPQLVPFVAIALLLASQETKSKLAPGASSPSAVFSSSGHFPKKQTNQQTNKPTNQPTNQPLHQNPSTPLRCASRATGSNHSRRPQHCSTSMVASVQTSTRLSKKDWGGRRWKASGFTKGVTYLGWDILRQNGPLDITFKKGRLWAQGFGCIIHVERLWYEHTTTFLLTSAPTPRLVSNGEIGHANIGNFRTSQTLSKVRLDWWAAWRCLFGGDGLLSPIFGVLLGCCLGCWQLIGDFALFSSLCCPFEWMRSPHRRNRNILKANRWIVGLCIMEVYGKRQKRKSIQNFFLKNKTPLSK